MKNNTNHTIAKLFNELSSGRSIDLDYNNRSYTFTRQNDNTMLVYFSNSWTDWACIYNLIKL